MEARAAGLGSRSPLSRFFWSPRLVSQWVGSATSGQFGALLDQALISGGLFLSTVIVARSLEVEAFGVFVLANFVGTIATMLQTGFLLEPLVIKGAALDARHFRHFLRAHAILQGAFIVASTAGVAAAAFAWEPLRPVAGLVVLSAALRQGQELLRRILYTRARMSAAVANNALNNMVQVPLLAAAAGVGALTLEGALGIMAFTTALAILLGVWQVRDLVDVGVQGGAFADVETRHPGTAARASLRMGLWTGLAAAVAAASTTSYPAILTWLAGLPATAGFGLIRQLLGPTQLLVRPLESYHLPRVAQAFATGGISAVNRALWRATLSTAPFHVLYVGALVAAPALLLEAVFGQQFAEHATALRLFAIGSALYIPVHLLKLEIRARGLQQHLLAMEVWTVLLVYSVGISLISLAGLVGAALTSIAVSLTQCLYFAAVITRSRSSQASRIPAPRAEAEQGETQSGAVPSGLVPPSRGLIEFRRGSHLRCYVPADNRRVLYQGLDIYLTDRPVILAHRALLRAWAAVGGVRLTHQLVRRHGHEWPLGDLLLPALPSLSTAAISTGLSPERNITIQLMDHRGNRLAFAKYAYCPGGRARLANEARMLQLVPEGTGPRLLHFEPFLDGLLLVQTPIPGRASLPWPWLPEPTLQLLFRLARPDAGQVAAEHPFITQLCDRAGRFQPLLSPLVEHLGVDAWPVVIMHGDFSVLNVRTDKGICRAFDWEFGTATGFPYLDAAHWLFEAAWALGRLPPRVAKRQASTRLRAYVPTHLREFTPTLVSLAALSSLVNWYPGQRTDAKERWLRQLIEAPE